MTKQQLQNAGREAYKAGELYDLRWPEDKCIGWLDEKAKGLKL